MNGDSLSSSSLLKSMCPASVCEKSCVMWRWSGGMVNGLPTQLYRDVICITAWGGQTRPLKTDSACIKDTFQYIF